MEKEKKGNEIGRKIDKSFVRAHVHACATFRSAQKARFSRWRRETRKAQIKSIDRTKGVFHEVEVGFEWVPSLIKGAAFSDKLV